MLIWKVVPSVRLKSSLENNRWEEARLKSPPALVTLVYATYASGTSITKKRNRVAGPTQIQPSLRAFIGRSAQAPLFELQREFVVVVGPPGVVAQQVVLVLRVGQPLAHLGLHQRARLLARRRIAVQVHQRGLAVGTQRELDVLHRVRLVRRAFE